MPAAHDHQHAHGESSPLLHSSGNHHAPHTFADGVAHEGESGRSGFDISKFFKIIAYSSNPISRRVNYLWPFAIVAIVLQYATNAHIAIFATSYIAIIPAANLLGFGGQEFARKMPKVAGILIETTFGSVVEIILFVALIVKHNPGTEDGSDNGDEGNLIPTIQAAIIGSIMTNLLLCLGLCFFVGGIRNHEKNQKFHAVVSETGNGVLLVAAFGLLIPSAFYSALKSETVSALHERFTDGKLQEDVMRISQWTSVILLVAFVLYVIYSCTSAHSIFDEVLATDEHQDLDREQDEAKPKLTLSEALVAIVIAIIFVAWLLIILVGKIEEVVERGVPDQFLGLILLPLVEKAAEHLTAIDDAWDGVINVALYHCIGPSIQTALLNAPLIVLIAWALGKPMDLNFEIFMILLLVLSILVVRIVLPSLVSQAVFPPHSLLARPLRELLGVQQDPISRRHESRYQSPLTCQHFAKWLTFSTQVGNFLRDQESNWLEGGLLVVSDLPMFLRSFALC